MEAAADLVIDATRVPVAEVAERIAVSAGAADGGCVFVMRWAHPPCSRRRCTAGLAVIVCRWGQAFAVKMPHRVRQPATRTAHGNALCLPAARAWCG